MTRLDLRSSSGQMPVAAVVALAVALAAVVGLIAGALWGLSGGGSGSSASGTPTPAPTSASPTSSPTTSPSESPTSSSPSPSGSTPAPVPTGSAPPAPPATQTSAEGWRLGSWRITNTGGTLGVTTTARNIRTETRSADLILYVYVDGELIATTTATVTDVPSGGTVPVQFTGTDPWKPGQKVLLLQVA
ncbi:MAG: hypothetical protein U0S36_13140 [Candidatus Nanopelagicales bacterium]